MVWTNTPLSVPAAAVLVALDSGALDSGAGRSSPELTAVGVLSIDSVIVTVDVISLSTRVV